MGSEGWLVVGGNLGGTISSLASSPTSNSWSVQGSFCGEKTLSTFRRGWSRTKDAGTQRGSGKQSQHPLGGAPHSEDGGPRGPRGALGGEVTHGERTRD